MKRILLFAVCTLSLVLSQSLFAIATPSTPIIDNISPSSGTPAGGETITITGSNFLSATTVTFGSYIDIFNVISDSVIQVVSPPGVGLNQAPLSGVSTADVSVSSSAGISNKAQFNYFAPNLFPSQPQLNGGNSMGAYTITIYGEYLTGVDEVYFGDELAFSVNVISDSEIQVIVPPNFSYKNIVSVSAYAGGQTGTPTEFTYLDPQISFLDESSSQDESIESKSIKLDILSYDNQPTQFDYIVTGTASNGTDFTLTDSTIYLDPWESSYEIVIENIVDDALIEGDETVTILILTPYPNSGYNQQHTFTIIDNDQPEISFSIADSAASEANNSYKIPVELSEAHIKNVSVDYTVSGTATNGNDYTLSNGTLTIKAGKTSDSITIADIIDDSMIENNETIIITLSNATNASLGTKTVYTYTIEDNDLLSSTKEIAIDNISIYPNPFTSHVNINNTENIKNISIKSISGSEVYNQLYSGEKNIKLNHLEQGVYFFTIEMNTGEQKVFKLIKE